MIAFGDAHERPHGDARSGLQDSPCAAAVGGSTAAQVSAALVALILTAAPAQPQVVPAESMPIAAQMVETSLPVLVELVTGWVAADLGLPMPATMPRVAFADQNTMKGVRDAAAGGLGRATIHEVQLLALYDTRDGTILLPMKWTGRSTAELSFLVHEIVHHFQHLSGERFVCPAAREKRAYEVQGRWLEAHGESLTETLAIDPMFVLVATNCTY